MFTPLMIDGAFQWAQLSPSAFPGGVVWVIAFVVGLIVLSEVLGIRYIPNNRVGIVEKLWSPRGSVPEGRIIALNGEAGFQADVLRGGLHFGLLALAVPHPQGAAGDRAAGQDRLRLRPRRRAAAAQPDARPGRRVQQLPGCAVVPHGRAGGAGGRAGARPARPAAGDPPRRRLRHQPRAVRGHHRGRGLSPRPRRPARAEDAGQLAERAERGRRLHARSSSAARSRPPTRSTRARRSWSTASASSRVQDGPSLPPGEIIAPAVGTDRNDKDYHNNYQDPEAFLRAGGRRGRQYVPLTDGTYFINRWFATVESIPKTVVPIGYVGVVVSYYGQAGHDLSGDDVPPRRARRRGRARRLGAAARAGQVSLQHLRRQHHPGADDQLRPALGHRPDRDAPLRREPALDRPGDQGRLRAARCRSRWSCTSTTRRPRASSSGSAT